MDTLGLLMVFTALLLGRQVATGRARETPSDFRDLVVGAFRGDTAQVQRVTSARGTVASVGVLSQGASAPTGVTPTDNTGTGTTVLAEMRVLAGLANYRYVRGATGPDAYDCSGLVWRAMRTQGIYQGARFTTWNFALATRGLLTRLDDTITPTVGDVVIWPTHHIGVVSGPDQMFSALNTHDGIIDSSISGNSKYYGGKAPDYYRFY